MRCPLTVNRLGQLGTVDYYAPCECVTLCELASCQYTRNGFLAQFNTLGTTTTQTVSLQATKCGGSMPLVNAAGALVTNANLTAGTVYRIYPQYVGGILRGVVQGL